jgi:hypothetical protein
MVYVVQNYKVYFGLYPSSGIYDKKSQQNPPEDGDRASLRNVVIFCLIYQMMDKVQNKPYSSVKKYRFHTRYEILTHRATILAR